MISIYTRMVMVLQYQIVVAAGAGRTRYWICVRWLFWIHVPAH